MAVVSATGKRVEHGRLYRSREALVFGRVGVQHLPFLLAYAFLLWQCFLTVGQQFEQAVQKAERAGIPIPQTAASLRTAGEKVLSDGLASDLSTGSWWNPLAAFDDEVIKAKEKAEEEKPLRLPSRFLPGFWPLFGLGATGVLHLLLVLLQIWSVRFRCLVRFREVAAVRDATHIHVTPAKVAGGGKAALLALKRQPGSALGTWFEYARRNYAWDARQQTFVKIRCRVNHPTGNYMRARGLSSETQMKAARDKYGTNRCVLDMPTFGDLYVQQLLSPLVVFQIFSSCLWLLDEYWQYSAFSIFMVFVFESTVVLSRLKSLSTLRNMGSGSKPVLVYRRQKWTRISSEELLPGDVISLTLQDAKASDGAAGDADEDETDELAPSQEDRDLVPCDALLLKGSAVVNEASLTGESIPQMKAALAVDLDAANEAEEPLNIKGTHKTHVLFGGTRLLQAKAEQEYTEDVDDEDDATGAEGASGEAGVPSLVATDGGDAGAGTFGADDEDDEEDDDDDGDDGDWDDMGDMPASPDGGCVCYVLRTGFSSSQGKLVRMIEGSADTKSVRGNDRDTALLLLLLLCFAVTSSGYVLYMGIGDESRSQYQLLLHCILIITSVIPPELPMQMALAVNTALMTLMKMQLFCTEPYRLPLAGYIDTCLFDKTGTLTTDELVAVGVVPPGGVGKGDFDKTTGAPVAITVPKNAKERDAKKAATPAGKPLSYEEASAKGVLMLRMLCATPEAFAVLVGCHSLVHIGGKVAGDPLEAAALNSMRWTIEERAGKKSMGTTRCLPQTAEGRVVSKGIRLPGQGEAAFLDILARHHFSSKLQRMSSVVRTSTGAHFVLVKGSPEIIGTLCRPESLGNGSWYNDSSASLAKQGMRVIALALKPLQSQSEVDSAVGFRARAEENLTFVGLVAFTCRVRKDTRQHIEALQDGGHAVAMVTGDALLTGIFVARDIGLTRPDPADILVLKSDGAQSATWHSYETGAAVRAFDATELPELARTKTLCVSGSAFNAAREASGGIGGALDAHLHLIGVYARMRPDDKESILAAMKEHGRTCMMCGDGANDVGALKQAHVGVALLSGFGDLNVERGAEEKAASKEVASKNSGATALITQADMDELRRLPVRDLKKKILALGMDPAAYPQCVEKADLLRLYRAAAQKAAQRNHDAQDEAFKPGTKAFQRRLMRMKPAERRAEQRRRQQQQMEERTAAFEVERQRLTAAGDSWATINAMRNVWSQEMEKTKAAAKERTGSKGFANSASRLAAQMDDLEDGSLPMVKLGDASIAAPFTSRMPSIRGCVDIIRQGRCTLVTSLQMHQILALNCLISAYSLSVLYLDGVKYGDYQMTCIGILMSISFITISRSKPLVKLSPERPFGSVFHPALFLSMCGQFLLHLFSMMWAKNEAKRHLPEDYEPDLQGKFKPNMLNTVIFLVTAIQQVSVFVVNIKGRPFMTGLEDNAPLLYSLLFTFGFTGVCATEISPQLNKVLKLVPFPSMVFRNQILAVLAADVALAFIWDRICLAFFAPRILRASFEGTDYKKVVRALFWVGVIFYMLSSLDWEELEKEFEKAEAGDDAGDDALGEAAHDALGDGADADGALSLNETLGLQVDPAGHVFAGDDFELNLE